MKKNIGLLLCAALLGTLLIGCGRETLSEKIKHVTWEPIDNQTDTDNAEEPLYKAFLNNEISVSNPYVEGMELTVMDDKDYETEFVDAQKSYALVDVNLDEKEELIFKISSYPSELMYILGIYNNELICFDVYETHTKSIRFGVYEYGFVWQCQNYDGFEMIYYSYSDDGQPHEVRRFTEGDEADMAAHEGGEPEWFMLNVQENSQLDEFISGKINADGNGLYGDDSFNISELPMNEEEWDSYSIGDKIDLDNDGNDELILNGPYGGMYIDASDDGVKVFATGDGTASNLSYTYCDNEIWIVHSDTMHGGRSYYKLQKYSGADNIVESVTLEMYYSEDETAAKTYYYNGNEISQSEYDELYMKYFS